ncbi:TIGR01777 family oxidoreductase [Litorilituus sediminis]|uniref:TIGR01777 family protein n=1 Tax=Litorilituus sediminis TaxID=718192 RepID=A0A4P6P2S2_9GAMM|nr:TIGR01777 family oxidoreductase [Litorilituus sediminis]QBG35523.1 TIGR01777 family protein [Litorilituus sediminis]
MKVLITGGTGLIGRQFIEKFHKRYQFTVLSRQKQPQPPFTGNVDIINKLPDENCFDVIINLAGEPIADKRWSKKQKDIICQSRWQISQALVDFIRRSAYKPQCLINGSAIGIYGDTGNTSVDESSSINTDSFSQTLCQTWEKIAMSVADECRVLTLRTGIVLAAQGGALSKMKMPFYFGLGAKISHGKQWMSWIHITDMINIIHFVISQPNISGAINCTAPNAVSNQEFSLALAQQLKRPLFLTIPAVALKLMMGESSSLLLESQRVFPQVLLDNQFHFDYETLAPALTNLLA